MSKIHPLKRTPEWSQVQDYFTIAIDRSEELGDTDRADLYRMIFLDLMNFVQRSKLAR